jgi:hypothetical protein
MFRLVVLVGCLVTATATAAAQSSPTPPASVTGAAGVSAPATSGTTAQPPSAAAQTEITAEPAHDEDEETGPTPEPPPGGLYGLPPASRVGPNLLPDPGQQLEPKPDIESDPLFLPAVLLIGGGSAVLLASLFTGLGAHSVYKQLERDCSDDICPAGSQQKIDNGQTLAIVSTVLTGVGLVAAGTGAALLVVAANRTGEAEPETAQVRLRLTSGPTPLGLGASASF